MKEPKYTEEQKKLIILLRKQGLTYKNICIEAKIRNETTVHNICVAAGLNKRHYPKRSEYGPGQKYHYYSIIKISTPIILDSGRKYNCYECLCECGKNFIITTKQIKRGQKSCGCKSISNRFKLVSLENNIINRRFNCYKQGATRRKLRFNLTLDEFKQMVLSNCHYCQLPPNGQCSNYYRKLKIFLNGVDRVNSNIGYQTDNCVPCCSFCNYAKHDKTETEFRNWLQWVKTHV